MAAPKRSAVQVLKDQETISELYLKGWQQSVIADFLTDLAKSRKPKIKYSVAMVKYDLKIIRDGWLESSVRDFDAVKAEQLAKLDQLEIEAWEQWRRSCGDYNRRVTEEKNATMTPGTNTRKETGEQYGDPRYMNVILSIIERRCKMLGLDAPQKVAPTDPTGQHSWRGASMEEINRRIHELNEKLGSD